jgi:hypothetical protein
MQLPSQFIAILGALLLGFIFPSTADEVRLSRIERLPDGSAELTVTGNAATAVSIQASSDLHSWTDLQTLSLNGNPVVYRDSQASFASRRVYRVRSVSSAPTTLPDLADYRNRVFPAPEGQTTIQYAPDGKLGFIVWVDQQLIFRERSSSGSWSEQVVSSDGNTFKPYLVFDFSAPREDYRFQPSAALVYDSSSRPHIFQANGRSIKHFTQQSPGSSWALSESIPNPQANDNIAVLQAVMGSGNILHFVALSSGSPRNLTYGSNKNGQWSWSTISTVGEPPLTYWAPPFAPRWLGLAVDADNNAHVVFRSSLDLTYDSAGHPRAYSELKYASNSSGQWNISVIQKPQDLSGEAANGASIAIGPNNKPAIVSWYDERADTGSAQESRMYYHQQDSNGTWSSNVIATAPDGYVAGDGPKGTGFSPALSFDRQGRAHILFLDHAGEHFGGIGQQEYAGNVRHGWWNGSSWSFETVFRQDGPLQHEAVYPAFAIGANELAITFLQRDTQWNLGSFPPLSNSSYFFRFLTRSLQ